MRQGSVVLKVTVIGYFLTTTSWGIDQETGGASPGGIRVMVRENGRLLVPVAVNGKKESRFLFDTGGRSRGQSSFSCRFEAESSYFSQLERY